jgi:hypothetical protein
MIPAADDREGQAAVPSGPFRRVLVAWDGSPDSVAALCEHAIEHGFGLLVLDRHGDRGLLHPGLGRVAAEAAKASEVPVLLIGARCAHRRAGTRYETSVRRPVSYG